MNSPSVPLLEIRDLKVSFKGRRGLTSALRGVDLTVAPGEVLGLVGESGSGKSVTGLSVMRLLDEHAQVSAESMKFNGEDLLSIPASRMRGLRGAKLAMIFQDPAMTLNPVLRIDTQMIEAVIAHESVSKSAARTRCLDVLARVGISDPERRLTSYPHQFSGGMRQRIAIAIAMLHKPSLIIADEPTTALDVTIQAQILYECERLCRETGAALIWVTHDLGVVERIADRVAVMYGGRVVEQGSVTEVMERPAHPYTVGLLASMPAKQRRGEPLSTMPPGGSIPDDGCAFLPRCSRSTAACEASVPADSMVDAGHSVRCLHPL